MSAREELAREVFIADNWRAPDPAERWNQTRKLDREYAFAIADGVLAAGYRKPRIITTVEELEALPNGSVVLDCDGLSLHKHASLGRWDASNGARNLGQHELERDAFPATVLWEPEPLS